MISIALRALQGIFLCSAILLALFATPATAQISLPGAKSVAAEPAPRDPYGRDTPRGLLTGYIQALTAKNYERAGDYLDLPESSESFRSARGIRLSRELEQLLDRGGSLVDTWRVSALPEGDTADGQKQGIDLLGKITVGTTSLPILAERIETANGGHAWLISQQTTSQISELFAKSRAGMADTMMPSSSLKIEIFSIPLGHAALALALMLATWGFFAIFLALLFRSLGRTVRAAGFQKHLSEARAARISLAAIPAALAVEPVLEFAGISVILRGMIAPALNVAIWIFAARIVVAIIDYLSTRAMARAQALGHVGSISFLLLARRAAKLTVLFLLLLASLSAIGVDMTAGLTALGIGGIAIALGSQKTIEHFVGSLSVVADRVVRIGDFCRFGTLLGTVEDIGIRSTRIRTLDRTVVTVPNGIFSSAEIENYTARDKFFFRHYLCLRPGTTRHQIIACLEGVREILEKEERIDQETRRARLVSLDMATPKIEVYAYVFAANWAEFLMHQENLILRIMDVIEHAGATLAAPTQDLRISREEAAPVTSTPPPIAEAIQPSLFEEK